jgi:predicted RNA-binding protein YlqC (UPF0109 family)
VKDLVTYLFHNLVEDPSGVEVREVDRDRMTAYEVRVAQADRGRVIGKEGRTIRSVRTLVAAAAQRAGKRATVEVIE